MLTQRYVTVIVMAQLIDAEGLALHEEMQRGFLELTHILAPVLHPASSTGTSSSSSSSTS